MSLSGSNTGALLPYVARNLLEAAASRAGISPEKLSAEIIYKALDELNLLTAEMTNRGIQLWKRHQIILPVYQNFNEIPTPPGTNLVTPTLTRRTLQRVNGGTAFSDAGGTASLAFDDDFNTSCVQTAPDGAIGMQFTTGQFVTQCGVLSAVAGTFALFFEWSNDGANYTALDAATVTYSNSGEWFWIDLQGSPNGGATYWRVRSVGTVPFGATEIFFGNSPAEVNLTPWNIDDYSNMPNKFQPGQIVNYYQQRDISEPTLFVWPMPDYSERYTTLTVWVTNYLDQVSDINQGLDFPPRWYEAVTAMLSVRLCRLLPEADYNRLEDLKQLEIEKVMLAQAEERDVSPTNYDLGLQYYTL